MGKLYPSLSPFPQPGNGKIFSYVLYLDTKVYGKKIKWPFSIFHWGRIVWNSQAYTVKCSPSISILAKYKIVRTMKITKAIWPDF